MTSLQSQYLLCPPLACITARTHQQPNIATSEYFTWETGPWQQEKQHQMPSGLRRISAQTVRNGLRENGLHARRPYFGAVLRRRHRLPRVWWCNRVRGWDLQNWRWVWFSDESRSMLQKRDGCTHVYRCWMRGSQGTASLRSTISAEEVWWCGAPYPMPKYSTGAHPRQP